MLYLQTRALTLFVSVNKKPVLDMWPPALKKIPSGNASVVPEDITGLKAWCYVAQDFSVGDPTRTNVLLYRNTEDRVKVMIRLQGFVAKIDIRALGNWKG